MRYLVLSVICFLCLDLKAQSFPEMRVSSKTVRVNIIVLQKSDGTANFHEDSTNHTKFLGDCINWVNWYMWAIKKKVHTDSGVVEVSNDSKIRYKLNKIHYVKNDYYWNTDNEGKPYGCPDPDFEKWWLYDLQRELIDSTFKVDSAVNLYLSVSATKYDSWLTDSVFRLNPNIRDVWCSRQPSDNLKKEAVINGKNLYLDYLWRKVDLKNAAFYASKTFAHELGHLLFKSFVHENDFKNLMHSDYDNVLNYLSDKQLQEAHENLFNTNMKKYTEFSPIY